MAARFTQSCELGGTVAAGLAQAAGFITQAVNDRMQQAMTEVRDEARRRVPFEYGNVQAAIKLQNDGGRRAWSVYVDETMPDDTGKYTVGDYALWLHESAGYTPKTPGTGPKYLENPFREIIDQNLLAELQALLREPVRDTGGRFASSTSNDS